LKSAQQKNLLLLQKFRNISFATEGIELLFYVVHCKDSAMLLARFIRSQIQKTKRHKLLISFLKHFLTILLDSKMAIVKGVKIMIKGRLNGVPRAKHKTIIVGDIPIQTFDTKLNFYQAVAHNASGSYGISVWLVEKM
jgi:ribosomal protein S3